MGRRGADTGGDPVGTQPGERGIHDLADVVRPAVEAGDLSVGADPEAELGREHHAVPALALDEAPDQRFVGKGPVDLGRVEQRDTGVDRLEQRRLASAASPPPE